MKRTNTFFWTATGLFSLMMIFSAYQYLNAPEMKSAFEHLGFPSYFRLELAIAKLVGASALLLPFVPNGFKQFAYAGFTFNLISASIAHISMGDGFQAVMMPLIFLLVLVVSYLYYNKIKKVELTKKLQFLSANS